MSMPPFTREQAEAAFWTKVDFDGPVPSQRQAGSLQREIAVAFRVGRATVEDVLAGRTWGHV